MSLTEAIKAWQDIVGTEHVILDSDELNTRNRSTIPFETNRSVAILKPKCTREVAELVKVSIKFRIPLYPISTGHNWGFGEACPVTADQVLLDLSRMNKIWEVNEELSYAVIEPGVTQGQLYQYLTDNKISLWLDVTGAGPDTSLIGNLCERGYGHLPIADKFINSCNYEVVLPDGTIISTGFGQFNNSLTKNVFKAGIGPSLDGLFTQSNLGIITKATFWLMPKPESFTAVAFALSDNAQLYDALDAVKKLTSQGILRSFIHFGNDLRVLSARTKFPYDSYPDGVLPPHARIELREKFGVAKWSAMTAFYGSKALVKSSIKEFRRSLKRYGKVVSINNFKMNLAEKIFIYLPFLQKLSVHKDFKQALPVFKLLKGIPERSHLDAVKWRNRNSINRQGRCHLEESGLIWHSPVVPFERESIGTALNIINNEISKCGLDPMISLILLSSRCLCMPTSINFDRSSERETANARTAYSALVKKLKEAGFYPYRSSIQSMNELSSDLDAYIKFTGGMKNWADPQAIIAPGRYSPVNKN